MLVEPAGVAAPVPFGIEPLVPVLPLPDAFPVDDVSVVFAVLPAAGTVDGAAPGELVTGAPPPVSVAVVPLVPDGADWMVSVDPAVLSAGFLPHAQSSATAARMLITFFMLVFPRAAAEQWPRPRWRAL